MKSTTAVQKSGWIVWWITNVFYALILISALALTRNISSEYLDPRDKPIIFVCWMFMLFFFIVIQVIAYFMVKYIHRDNSYIYPIILIVLAFLGGASLYFIPGIWGVLYVNHEKLNQ
jgi:amino acid transporter